MTSTRVADEMLDSIMDYILRYGEPDAAVLSMVRVDKKKFGQFRVRVDGTPEMLEIVVTALMRKFQNEWPDLYQDILKNLKLESLKEEM